MSRVKAPSRALTHWHAIQSEGEVLTLDPQELARGRLAWRGTDGRSPCEDCGCEIMSGRGNDESDRDLKARLKGKRGRVVDGAVVCPSCSKCYGIKESGPISVEDADRIGLVRILKAPAKAPAVRRSR